MKPRIRIRTKIAKAITSLIVVIAIKNVQNEKVPGQNPHLGHVHDPDPEVEARKLILKPSQLLTSRIKVIFCVLNFSSS